MVSATVANVNRAQDVDAFKPSDFMPALRKAMGVTDAPLTIGEDLSPEELSSLIDAQMFGKKAVH